MLLSFALCSSSDKRVGWIGHDMAGGNELVGFEGAISRDR